MATKSQKSPVSFYCEKCDYTTSNKKDYNKHILTAKHQNAIQSYTNANTKIQCFCGKIFKHTPSLYRHKRICVNSNDNSNETESNVSLAGSNLIIQLIKQNQEFKELLIEQNTKMVDTFSVAIGEAIKQCSTITNNTNTVNSNNKTFNLQVFLNEDCKDAMNITDFVNSINLQLSDLEHVGKVGYVEGISNIIIKNLNALDVTKRPVHCTDPKRETIYIKDGDVWEKDEDDNKKLRKMIRSVAFRNCKNTRLFKEKYPDCMKSESKYSDMYNKIIIEVMGGGPKSNDIENQNKIIKKIAKVMTIDKQRT